MTAGIIAGDTLIAFALIVAVYLALIMRIRMRFAERKGSYLSILKGELLLCGMTVILGLNLRWQIAKRIGHPVEARIESAAPPRVSPSSFVRMTPSRPICSENAAETLTAS